jgi:hypothetical protein
MVGKAHYVLWIEMALAVLTAALFVVTLVSREWIELVFSVDPDRGSGALEWGIVTILFVASATFSSLARVEWKKHAAVER